MRSKDHIEGEALCTVPNKTNELTVKWPVPLTSRGWTSSCPSTGAWRPHYRTYTFFCWINSFTMLVYYISKWFHTENINLHTLLSILPHALNLAGKIHLCSRLRHEQETKFPYPLTRLKTNSTGSGSSLICGGNHLWPGRACLRPSAVTTLSLRCSTLLVSQSYFYPSEIKSDL